MVSAQAEYKVLLLGVEQAGKTTLLERICNVFAGSDMAFSSHVLPTVGLNLQRVSALGVNLVFWDLGGKAGLRAIWEKYYREAHAVIFVLDSADQERFGDVADTLRRALQHRELDGAPVLIAANKQDSTTASSQADISRMLGLDKLERPDRAFRVLETSGSRGDGIREAVAWVVESIRRSPRAKALR